MPIYALGELEPQIHPDAYVHPDATVIGDVRLGAHASVWPQAVLRGDRGYIEIGERSNIQDGTVIHTTAETPAIVGPSSAVGHSVHIEGARIGENCLIASGSIVLNGTVVEDGAVVGAGAVISFNGHVPSGQIALGVPARCRENNSFSIEGVQLIVRSYMDNAEQFRAKLRRLD
ncbi:MAG: gamma carbonic anhydrase family protein [Pseudonocardiaceae bacterium]|nr:gamma carbonic anhydrase family protein [Pseudonocardiaceae bacterium]